MSPLKTLAFAGLVIASNLSQAAMNLEPDRKAPGFYPIPCGVVESPRCWEPSWPGNECRPIFDSCKRTPKPRPIPKPWEGVIDSEHNHGLPHFQKFQAACCVQP